MKTWEITLSDGRVVKQAGLQMLVDDVGALLIIDGTGGDGVAFAAGPTGWIDCTREGPNTRTAKVAHTKPRARAAGVQSGEPRR